MNSTETYQIPQPLEETPKVTDEQILLYIWSVIEKYRDRGQGSSIECILCEEKLIHISLMIHQKDPNVKFDYELSQQLMAFVQKINKIAMEQMGQQPDGNQAKFISKAVDIVMLPQSIKVVPETTLSKLKILTFNNLGCVLKKHKHLSTALKAVSFALEL